MYWRYGRISRDVYDYCIRTKLVDGALMAKWRKPGYGKLCSTYVINSRNYNFGTVSICRVPPQSLGEDRAIECPMTGCRGCASGPGSRRNIFGNKYGQFLARIQIKREERAKRLEDADRKRQRDDENEAEVVGRPTGPSIWAADQRDGFENDDDDDDQVEGPPRPTKQARLEEEELEGGVGPRPPSKIDNDEQENVVQPPPPPRVDDGDEEEVGPGPPPQPEDDDDEEVGPPPPPLAN